MPGLTPFLLVLALAAGGTGCRSVGAGRLAVPPAGQWQVTASASAEDQTPDQALDGRTNTWWRSGPEEPQWIEVDLGRAAMVGGLSLHWGEPHAAAYAIRTSLDGVHWALVYETAAGAGGLEPVLFDPLLARHVRVVVLRGVQGTGAALRTLRIRGLADRPQVRVDGVEIPDAMALLDGDPGTTWRSDLPSALLEIDLRWERPIGSVRVDWGAAGFASNVVVEVSTDRLHWNSAGQIQARAVDFDVLLCNEVHLSRYVRLWFSGASSPDGFEVAGIALRGGEGISRPWEMYELAASQAPEGLYPEGLRRRQSYWTVAAGPRPGDAEGLLDEWGTFAADPQGPTLSPVILTDASPQVPRQAADRLHQLAGDGTPMPETIWHLPSGLVLRIRAMSRPGSAPPLTWVNYELANDSLMVQTGRIAWVVRPVRLPPPWAGGGLAPIYRVRRAEPPGIWQEIWLNGRRAFAAADAALSFGAAAFDGGDVADRLLRGEVPPARPLRDPEGLASAAWWQDYHLQPGERLRLVVAAVVPDSNDAGLRRFPWPHAEEDAGRVADAFDREWVDALWAWRSETDRYAPRIARPDAIDCLHAQVGWLLGIRSLAGGGRGESTESMAFRVAALLRAGQAPVARQWIQRVAEGIATDGWVPAGFQPDGTPAPRIGQEGFHASQGQLAFMAMEYYRFTQDTAFLNELYPAMRSAMAYLQRLRAGLDKAEARLPAEDRELLEGLLPLSAARPGFPRPAYVYADHYWTLLGWREVRRAASILGLDEDATWADDHYGRWKAAVRRSLRAHLDRRDTAWLPGAADDQRFDAASVALLFWPCEETDLVEPHELQTSLDLFYEGFLRRGEGGQPGTLPFEDAMLLAPLASMGRGDYAREVLYALLDTRRPRGWHGWADWALGDSRRPGVAGFMPDLRAAAAYVIGVRGLAARENGRRLDLFSGAPPEWLQHGDGFRVYGMPTAFGLLDLHGLWRGNQMVVEIGGRARPPEGYRLWWPRQIEPERVLANGQHLKTFDALGATLPHDFQGIVEAVFPFRAPWPRDP